MSSSDHWQVETPSASTYIAPISAPNFEIEITEQGWINDDPESATYDLCSHGAIRLVIGGQVIAAGDPKDDYTISTSALALLRTLESDHSPEQPVASHLILHCGMLGMSSCPIGIDWSVSHKDERVQLHDVVRYDTIFPHEGVRFPELAVELGEEEYRDEIVAFAEKAKEPFVGVEKEFEEDYVEFWDEYDARLNRARR